MSKKYLKKKVVSILAVGLNLGMATQVLGNAGEPIKIQLKKLAEEAKQVMVEENLVLSLQNCTTNNENRTIFLELYWTESDTETDVYGNPKKIRYVKRSKTYNDLSIHNFELDTDEYVIRKAYSVGSAENSSIEGSLIASPHFSVGIHEYRWNGQYGGAKIDMDIIKRGIFNKKFIGEINAGGVGGVNLGFDCDVPFQAFK